MSVCDVCSLPTRRDDGFVLTTREVVTSPAFWRTQFAKYQAVLDVVPTREERAAFLGEQAIPLVLSPSGWLVCSECSRMFAFDEQVARECALSGKERPDAGPSNWKSVDSIVFPIIVEYVDAVADRKRGLSMKKYFQCSGCGSVLIKNPDTLQLAEAGLTVSGGTTCSDCRTRSDARSIYSGAYDFECDDEAIETMLRDPDNAIPNKAARTWTYLGKTIYGPASKR